MIPVDTILTNGTVVTMDGSYTVYQNGAVAIRDDLIMATGPADEIAGQYSAQEVVDCAGQAIIPGLINAHTHAPMTLLRGLADDLRLDVWLMGYIMSDRTGRRRFIQAAGYRRTGTGREL